MDNITQITGVVSDPVISITQSAQRSSDLQIPGILPPRLAAAVASPVHGCPVLRRSKANQTSPSPPQIVVGEDGKGEMTWDISMIFFRIVYRDINSSDIFYQDIFFWGIFYDGRLML